MLKNYLIIAWRNLWKHKLFSLINLSGLTISISVALVVYLIVQHEYSYDTFHKDRDRIFRVVTNVFILGEEYNNPGVPIPLAEAAREQMTGIDEAVGFFRINYPVTILAGNGTTEKEFKRQDNVVLTGPGYFRLFDHQWLAGTPETSLNDPFKVVLTESKAQTYFGLVNATDAMGREIIYGDSIQTVVSGIVKDIDKLTDLNFKEFISISTVAISNLQNRWSLDDWDFVNSDFQLMVKLTEGVGQQSIEQQFLTINENRHDLPETYEFVNLLQPLSDLHFNTNYDGFDRPPANKSVLGGLLAVAMLLLTLGSINYINLTTARGNLRAKEIGVRKTLGSSRKHLVIQFVVESMVLSLLAALSALLMVPLIIELFQEFIPAGLEHGSLLKPHILFFLLALTGTMSILTGLYPGLVLSNFQPVSILKNTRINAYSRKSLMQQTLTVVQFMVAVFFVVSTLIVASQIRYALIKDLGFKKEGIIAFLVPNSDSSASNLLVDKLTSIPEIKHISRGGSAPSGTGITSKLLKFYQGGDVLETHVQLKFGDENYLNVYDIPLIAGKNITASDTIKEFIINQSFLKRLGMEEPQHAIGQLLEEGGGNYPIVGVVADFHTQPIHQAIAPAAITNAVNKSTFHIALKEFKNNTVPWKRAFEKMESTWNKIYPEEPFTYQFYDQRIASWYQQEQNTSKLLGWITGTALFISCLGLLGLTVFIVNQRTKEIGIRKVLGVTIGEIVILLSKDFIKLILIAIMIGIPMAWYFISKWLNNFAYPVEIQWWMFVLPAFCLLVVAGITISTQVLKAALANPVDSLRNE